MADLVDPDRDDALRDVLRSVRLESSLVSRATLRQPYAVRSDGISDALFHAVASGSCTIALDGEAPIRLEPGQVALLPHGHAHVIADDPDRPAVPLRDVPVDTTRSRVDLLDHGGEGPATTILCGSFRLRHPAAEMMLRLLPPLVHVHDDASPVVKWFGDTLDTLSGELDRDEPGADAVVDRLTDILVIHVLRSCAQQTPTQPSGWLSALRDQKIGRALASIHGEPGAPWTAESLASHVGMSRSAFFARFSDLVGEPPAQYLARWRMHVAADLMNDHALSMGQLAQRVGYGSEDAFSRVFKRHMGISPGQYRRQRHH